MASANISLKVEKIIDKYTILPSDWSEEQRHQLFFTANQCFNIICNDEDEEEIQERKPSAGRITTDID